MDKEPKNVDIVITDPVKVEGKHYAIGDVLPQCDAELAKELAGAGRARLATEEEVAKAKKAASKAAA